MKKITQKQIDDILAVLMELNIPVKTYASIQDLFVKLPVDVTEKK